MKKVTKQQTTQKTPTKVYKQDTNRFPFAIKILDKKFGNTLWYIYREVVLTPHPAPSLPPAHSELVFSFSRCALCLQKEPSCAGAGRGTQEAGGGGQGLADPFLCCPFHSTKAAADVKRVQEVSISEASSMKLATGLRSRSGNSLYSPLPSSASSGGSPTPSASRGSAGPAGAAGSAVPLPDRGWRAGFSSRGGSRRSFGSSSFPAASLEGSSSNNESRGLALYWISCISEGKQRV